MQIRPVIKQDVPQIIKLISDIRAEYDCVLDVETEECGLLAPDDYFHRRRLYERLGFECIGKCKLDDLNNSVEFGFKMKL